MHMHKGLCYLQMNLQQDVSGWDRESFGIKDTRLPEILIETLTSRYNINKAEKYQSIYWWRLIKFFSLGIYIFCKNTEYRICSACGEPISDKFLLEVSGRSWHARCLRCSICQLQLDRQPSCFIRDRAVYCKTDYAKSFGAKCSICTRGISSSDWVRKARDHVYHLACFACAACHRQLSTGEEFALHEDRVLCKAHYLEILDGGTTSSDDGCDAEGYHKNKAKRVRTTFTEEQLQVLQANFQLDSNPDGQDLERIAQITGLSKRVTQVWFQNSRARQKKHMHTGKVKNQMHNRDESSFNRHINLHLTYSLQQNSSHSHKSSSIFSQGNELDSSLDELSQESTMHCMQNEV